MGAPLAANDTDLRPLPAQMTHWEHHSAPAMRLSVSGMASSRFSLAEKPHGSCNCDGLTDQPSASA